MGGFPRHAYIDSMKITRTTIRKIDGEYHVLAYVNNEQGLPFKRYPAGDFELDMTPVQALEIARWVAAHKSPCQDCRNNMHYKK